MKWVRRLNFQRSIKGNTIYDTIDIDMRRNKTKKKKNEMIISNANNNEKLSIQLDLMTRSKTMISNSWAKCIRARWWRSRKYDVAWCRRRAPFESSTIPKINTNELLNCLAWWTTSKWVKSYQFVGWQIKLTKSEISILIDIVVSFIW